MIPIKEVWKDVVGHEGRYMVSNLGRVKSMNYLGHSGERVLKTTRHHTGYMVISLGKKPKKMYLVHILVATAFIENPYGKRYVNHIDGNKENNTVENLEWVTSAENVHHAIRTGLRDPHNVPRKYGADHYSSKPVYQFDLYGNLIKKWDSQSDAARFYRKKGNSINLPVDKQSHTRYGFVWLSSPDGFSEWCKNKPKKPRNQRKIEQLDSNGNVVELWDGIEKIAQTTSFSAKGVLGCCNHDRKTHGGFVWRYADD